MLRERIERALGSARDPSASTPPALDDSMRVLVVSAAAHRLPIYLRFGGFNECPTPAQQAVALRAWQDRFGARLVFVGEATLELLVARPPRDLESVRTLAWEHYLFCPDIVDQGTNSVAGLAHELAGSPTWFFWWD